MLPHPGLRQRLIGMLRSVRPQRGALANARDALHADDRARHERRDAALTQGRAFRPETWPRRDPTQPACTPPHAVQFARNDAELGGWLAAYVADGLAREEHCVVIATRDHRVALRQRLALAGLSDAAERLLVDADADEVMQGFMREGDPDPELFPRVLRDLVSGQVPPGAPVRGYGEMVGLLLARGAPRAALQLEVLWELLLRELGFPLLCTYPLLHGPGSGEHRRQISNRHSHLAPVGQA